MLNLPEQAPNPMRGGVSTIHSITKNSSKRIKLVLLDDSYTSRKKVFGSSGKDIWYRERGTIWNLNPIVK